MAVRRPEPVIAADRALDEARRWLKHHQLHCGQCRAALAAALPWRTCDTGWALVKWELRQRNALQRVAERFHDLAALQESLF